MGPEGDRRNPYEGRWIARIRSQVIGQGGSPEQAAAAAWSSRSKEIPIIAYIPLRDLMSFHPIVFQIQKVLAGYPGVYLVGGTVRDALSGATGHDLDFVCMHDPAPVAKEVARAFPADIFTLDVKRKIYRVLIHLENEPNFIADFASLRGDTLDEDLAQRDFSINAMAVDLSDPYKLIDPLGGAAALKDHLLVSCAPQTLQDDPLRVLRGVRFAAEWNFHFEENTRERMKAYAPGLSQVSAERKRDELLKILATPRPGAAIRMLQWLGELNAILPGLGDFHARASRDQWDGLLSALQTTRETQDLLFSDLPHQKADNFYTGMVAMRLGRFQPGLRAHFKVPIQSELNRSGMLLLGMLTGAVAEADGALSLEQIGGMLKLSKSGCRYLMAIHEGMGMCDQLVRHGEEAGPLQVYRYYRATGDSGVDAALAYTGQVLSERSLANSGDRLDRCLTIIQRLLDGWWQHEVEWVHPAILLDGDEVMRILEIPPGPQIAYWLQQISEQQVAGVFSTRDEAAAWLKKQNRDENRP